MKAALRGRSTARFSFPVRDGITVCNAARSTCTGKLQTESNGTSEDRD